MSCEQYQQSITDAALGKLPGEAFAEFEAHCAACQACHADLCRVRELLNSIDRGVAEMVAAQPSAKFAARLRQRLSDSSRDERFASRFWLPAAAGGLAVVTLFAFLSSSRWPRPQDSNSRQSSAQVAEKGLAPSPAPRATLSDSRAAADASPAAPVRVLKANSERAARSRSMVQPLPEVIVPPHEWAAITKLAADVSSGRVSMVPVSVSTLQTVEPVEIASSELPVFKIVLVEVHDPLSDEQDR